MLHQRNDCGKLEPWAINHKAFKKKIYSALIQRRILQKTAALHAITDEEVKHIRAFGVDNEILMISNGINPREFQALRTGCQGDGSFDNVQDLGRATHQTTG